MSHRTASNGQRFTVQHCSLGWANAARGTQPKKPQSDDGLQMLKLSMAMNNIPTSWRQKIASILVAEAANSDLCARKRLGQYIGDAALKWVCIIHDFEDCYAFDPTRALENLSSMGVWYHELVPHRDVPCFEYASEVSLRRTRRQAYIVRLLQTTGRLFLTASRADVTRDGGDADHPRAHPQEHDDEDVFELIRLSPFRSGDDFGHASRVRNDEDERDVVPA